MHTLPRVDHLADLVWADEWTKALRMVKADQSLLTPFENALWYRFDQPRPFLPLDILQRALTDIRQPLCLGAALGDSEIRDMVDKKWIRNSNGNPVVAQHSVIDIYPAEAVVVPAGEGVIEVPLANLPVVPDHVASILGTRSCVGRRDMGAARKRRGPLHIIDNELLLDPNQIVKSDSDRQAWNLFYNRKEPVTLFPENPVFSLNLFYLADDNTRAPDSDRQWVNVEDALSLLHLTETGGYQPVRANATPSLEQIEAARRSGHLSLGRNYQAKTDGSKVRLQDFRRSTANYLADGIELWNDLDEHALPYNMKGWLLNSLQNFTQRIDMVTHGSMFDLPGTENTLTFEVSSWGATDLKDINPRPLDQPRFWPQGRKPYRKQFEHWVVCLLNQVAGQTAPYQGQFHHAKRATLGSIGHHHPAPVEGTIAVPA